MSFPYSTAADWNEWLRRFNVDLLKESPSPALRCCGALAQAYTPLARDLFHAAFVSCWHELNDQYQDSLVRSLQTGRTFVCLLSVVCLFVVEKIHPPFLHSLSPPLTLTRPPSHPLSPLLAPPLTPSHPPL